ncbi:uncharacterized protein LOC110449590 [Mizuhopecten yessoensis]|uniref:uncharacterized protein LOC110449590 n=1 Tax=Mizuhopecten yessoensis TaxID=6573 RepID=UPI000B45CA13|nr:uncharacterized protein LOC110449590 [Mizuhopecten yessoensis]
MWDRQDDASMHLFFRVDPFPAGDVRAKNATLSLFARARSDCECSVGETANVRLLVEVNQYLQALRPRRNNRHNRMRRPRMQNLDIDVLQWNDQGWMHFDVTDAVQDWMTRPRRSFGLEIKVERLQRVTPGRRITDFDAHEVFGQADCTLPLEIACLDRLPLLSNNDYSPILEVWTETRPTLGKRKKRSLAVSNRQYQKKRATLINDFYEES